MGIRYHAYPVAPNRMSEALASPRDLISGDPLVDAWGLVATGQGTWVMTDRRRPEMLYLDKCWSFLQRLTAQTGPRPAQHLFAGAPTFTDDADFRPHVAALTPDELGEVADDLDVLTANDLNEYCCTLSEEDAEYVRHYFAEARSFARMLADRGWGLAYLIG